MGQCRGAAGGSLKWFPPSRLELPLLLFCCLDFVTSYRILRVAEEVVKFLSSIRVLGCPILLR